MPSDSGAAPVEVVVFDFGGVLASPPFAGLEAYGAEIGLPVGTLSAYFRGDPEFAKVETGAATVRDFFLALPARVQQDHGTDIELRRVARLLGDARALNPEMLALVAELRPHHRLAVLTNNTSDQEVWLTENLPPDSFELVLNSAVLGLRKPDPLVYDELLRRLGAPADRVVYVDDFEENLPPAQALGIRTVLFEDAASCRAQLAAHGVRTSSGA